MSQVFFMSAGHCRFRLCAPSLLLAFLASLLAACTAGEIELYEPEGRGLGQGLTVKVELEAAAELGEALGWTDGVPGAEVRVHRIGTDFSWQTALTDSSGVAQYPDLLPGSYRVAAYRLLTDNEVQQVGTRRRAFGDGRMIALAGPMSLTLTVALDLGGSLLIGELYGSGAPGELQYRFHHYLEVYNNSDTTIYLDGKILGMANEIDRDYASWSCDQSLQQRIDPDGVWSRFFYRFPGSGSEYALAPGEIAVVAMDAVDHSQIYSSLPDLTHADFELFGPADVDNPQVPNMPEIGTAIFWWGHGMWMRYESYFLSNPVDVETLPRFRYPDGSYEYVRFPRQALLDVLVTSEDFALSDQLWPPCLEGTVHRNFDRLAGGFIRSPDPGRSVQRIVIDVTPDGRAILQDTNTSAVDLIRAPYTVGTLSEHTP